MQSCCNSTYRLRYWNLETYECYKKLYDSLQQYLPFTVLKRCKHTKEDIHAHNFVATVLTVYGIETLIKHIWVSHYKPPLQQYLPFTVLKLYVGWIINHPRLRCNSTYRLRYWN